MKIIVRLISPPKIAGKYVREGLLNLSASITNNWGIRKATGATNIFSSTKNGR